MKRELASEVVLVQQGFTLFEIAAFALVSLILLGWVSWIGQMFWALLFLVIACYIVSTQLHRFRVPLPWHFGAAVQGMLGLARVNIGVFFSLCLLSLLAFATIDLATYVAMTAFDTEIVLIQIERPVLLMAIVCGYISARLVPITPGGIGQWELGFATGLSLGQADVSVAMLSVAIVANLLRIGTGLTLMGVSMLRYSIPTTRTGGLRSIHGQDIGPRCRTVRQRRCSGTVAGGMKRRSKADENIRMSGEGRRG